MSEPKFDQVKNNYPNLIAIPYAKTLDAKGGKDENTGKTNPDDPQRKDYQRICLEMILSFNASVCLANYYSIKSSGDEKKTNKLMEAVKKHYKRKLEEDGELKYDLGQMSIGKWNQIARDTSQVLFLATDGGKNNDFLIKQIGSLYQNKNNAWNTPVNQLITKRNNDAHGEVISDPEGLAKELDKRQEMLDQLMTEMSFLADYSLIVPIDDDVQEGILVHICKDLSGFGDTVISLDNESLNDTEIERYNTYLYNKKTKKTTCLPLDPMVINYNASPETEELDTYIYSKTANNKKGLHYSNFHGSIDLKDNSQSSVGSLLTSHELCRNFSRFRALVEDEKLINRKEPKISIRRKFKSDSTLIDEDVYLDIIIENNGDADALDMESQFIFPRKGFLLYENIESEKPGNPTYQEGKKEEHIIKPFDLPKKKSTKLTYKLKACEPGGQYQFDEMMIKYNYHDENSDSEELIKHEEENGINVVSADPIIHHVLNPNEPESQVPIVNLTVTYSNHIPKIGEEIDFIVDVENIGKSIATDVDIHIFPPPEEMDLISGSTSWLGNINPSDKVTRKFKLRPRKQGIFSIKMRDVLYRNLQGDLFKTVAYEDHKILVQNEPRNKYRFLMEDVWEDLVLDESEIAQITRNQEYFKTTDDFTEEDKKIIEHDVKVRAIKNIINEILTKVSLPVKQITRTSKDSNMIGYCLDDYPFFLIDFTEIDKINLLLMGDFSKVKGLGDILKDSCLSKMKNDEDWYGKFSDFKFWSISLLSLGEIGGAKILKRLVNESIRYVENNGYYMTQFLNELGPKIGYDNLFSKINLIDGRVEGIVTNKLKEQLRINSIWLCLRGNITDIKIHKDITLVVQRTAGLKKELGEIIKDFSKNTGEFKNGVWSKKLSSDTKLEIYCNFARSDEAKQEMVDSIKKHIFDIAEANSKNALKEMKKENKLSKKVNNTYFDYLRDFVETELKDEYHFRSEPDSDEQGEIIIFYKGKELPLYQEKDRIFCYKETQQKLFLKFKYIEKDTFENFDPLMCEVKVNRKDYWFYRLDVKESSTDQDEQGPIKNTIQIAIGKAGNRENEISYHLLKECITDPKGYDQLKQIFPVVIDSLNEWVPYKKIGKGIEPKDLKAITAFVNKNNFEEFLHYNHYYEWPEDEKLGKGRIQLNPKYYRLVKQVLDDLGT